MAQQQQFPPNYNYMPQQPPQQHQNGQQQNFVNGFPQMAPYPMKPMQPMQVPAQQLPPTQPQTAAAQPKINYQNFQTNAIQGVAQPVAASGMNGSNSALSSRTSSPGVQMNAPHMIPTSQLPPSKSYPSYQHLHGHQQQPTPMPTIPQHNVVPPSQFPQPTPSMAPQPVNSNINNNNNNETSQALASHQNLSASMKNLTLTNPVTTFPSSTPSMPSSKSDQNLLNNNNMQQQPLKPLAAMQKRPMYPQQPQAMPPMPQQQPQTLNQPVMQQQQPVMSQPHQFNSFPGVQQPPQQPNLAQQPRGNLQYQSFPQPQQQQPQVQQPQQAPGVVQQGFNRLWGRETVDLLQNRHILPQTKVLPPTVKLNHQFHEAANCSADLFRCTLTKIPESNSLLQKSRLPLGILIHPYRDLSVSALKFALISNTLATFFSDFIFPSFSESSRYQLLFNCPLSSVSHLHQSICIFRR